VLEKELAPLQAQREGVRARLGRLGEAQSSDAVADEYRTWLEHVDQLGQLRDTQPSAPPSPEALDRTLTSLAELEQRSSRQLAALERLLTHVSEQVPAATDVAPLQVALEAAQSRYTRELARLSEAQEQAAAFRQAQVELEDQQRSMQALARLALRHLGPECPVCAQQIDETTTRSRLDTIAAGASGSPEPAGLGPDVASVAADTASAEREVSEATAALTQARQQAQRREQWQTTFAALTREVADVAAPDDPDALAVASEHRKKLISQARELRARGERLSLGLARVAEAAQRQHLESSLALLEEDIADRDAQLQARRATGELASRLINAIRASSELLVGSELERMEPVLQRIFATVDPHPSFRAVGFLTKTVRGKGHLWTTLDDPTSEKQVQDPSLVLSSSQLNVLAVSVFLALNLAIPTLPLQVVALDDPLQSLDNVNLLGLADLLRRVKNSRQVIVSTHDDRLAKLLERKLRPVGEGGRTVRIDLRGWSTTGPTVGQSEVEVDAAPLRLIATA
jgi:exonuclease SbcC